MGDHTWCINCISNMRSLNSHKFDRDFHALAR
jgi:hypothetical protein